MNLYTVKDNLAEEFGDLFEAKNDAVAARKVQNMFRNYPETKTSDFGLYLVGTFDHANCDVQIKDKPVYLDVILQEPSNGKTIPNGKLS
nr:MAG: nonstructural protein [Microvirus sp.]